MLEFQGVKKGSKLPTVLIIGMGDTGVLVAAHLRRNCRVIAVTTRPVLLSGQELGKRLTDLSYWKKSYLTPLDAFRKLDDVECIHGKVIAVNTDEQVVSIECSDQSTQSVCWDYLVIASGISNGFWRTAKVENVADVESDLERQTSTIVSAKRIAVMGGGPSGTSVAFNVASRFPDKDVTLFFSGEDVLPGYHPKTRAYHMAKLREAGVTLKPGHRADPSADGTRTALKGGVVTFSSGQPDYSADALIWATGAVHPNTAFLPPDMLDEAGFIKTEKTMTVVGYSNVFAIGDAAATDPLRSSARNWAYRILCRNINALIQGKAPAHRFQPPGSRWGSVLGLQSNGLTLHQQNGGRHRLPVWFVQLILWPWIVTRGIYGGIREQARERQSSNGLNNDG